MGSEMCIRDRTYTIDGSSSINFETASNAVVTGTDGVAKNVSISNATVQAISLIDEGAGSQLVLLQGTVDDGLLMQWDYNTDDRFIRATFYQSQNATWQTINTFERDL